MIDDTHTGCGIYPLIFHGWMEPACEWHDGAYTEGSWQENHLTRLQVDDEFFRMCMLLADGDCVKEAQALACYKIVRAVGWIFWEGKLDEEDESYFIDMPVKGEENQGKNGYRIIDMTGLREAFKGVPLGASGV